VFACGQVALAYDTRVLLWRKPDGNESVDVNPPGIHKSLLKTQMGLLRDYGLPRDYEYNFMGNQRIMGAVPVGCQVITGANLPNLPSP